MATVKKETWTVYLLKKRPVYVGMVQAADAKEALELALKQFEIPEREKFRVSVQRG